MFERSHPVVWVRLFASCAWAMLVGGCTTSDPLARAGVSVRPPTDWKPVASTTWPVAGTPLAAWSGPSGSSLVVYQSLAAPGLEAKEHLDGLVHRLENLPDLRVVAQRTERVKEFLAGRLEAVAPGPGDALAPSGMGQPVARLGQTLRPTRRVLIVIPRAADTLWLIWHAPEDNHIEQDEAIRATLASLVIDQNSLATSSY
jgi:hypothetical protein